MGGGVVHIDNWELLIEQAEAGKIIVPERILEDKDARIE